MFKQLEPRRTNTRLDAKELIRRQELQEKVDLAVAKTFRELVGIIGWKLMELEESPTPAKVRQLFDDIQTWLLTR